MLNLLTADQTKQVDQYTIDNEPIRSIDLMERASRAFTEAFVQEFPDKSKPISVYCGTGNNGGDGLAVARLLSETGYSVSVNIARFSGKASQDFEGNLARLMSAGIAFDEVNSFSEISDEHADLLIDALLGSGLNKPLDGEWAKLVKWLNSLGKPLISVDIPTGFRGEGPISKDISSIHSDLTITFQRPKINFLLPESVSSIKRFKVVEIGLDENFIQDIDTPYTILSEADITSRLNKREPFSHKGTYGHALIIAGSSQSMGAALLCSEASLYCGSGLTTACIPPVGLTALNVRVPEVMASLRFENRLPADLDWSKYNALAIGPGLGTLDESLAILDSAIQNFRRPMVIDADALNLISTNPDYLVKVPKLSILTPHVKEFDRLFGNHPNWWQRMAKGMERAKELGLIILLKNRYTMIFTPDGNCIFNPTGTPAMATGGMGDVLTGMITSFLAQGYEPEDAALLGVYLHGKTGEEIQSVRQTVPVTASKLIEGLPGILGIYET